MSRRKQSKPRHVDEVEPTGVVGFQENETEEDRVVKFLKERNGCGEEIIGGNLDHNSIDGKLKQSNSSM